MEDELLDDFEFDLDETPIEDEEEVEIDAEEGQQELQEEDDDTPEEESPESEEQDGEDEQESEEDDEVSFTPFIESLLEEGVLEYDGETEYEDSPEGFKKIIEDNVNSKVEKYLAGLPEDVQRLIEVGLKGGDVREAFTKYEEIDYSAANIEDEEVAKTVVRDYYKTINPKWSDSKISDKIEMLADAGVLEEEAKEGKEFMVEKTSADRQAYLADLKAQEEAQEKQYYDELNSYTKLIDESEGFFGLKFSNKSEKEAFKKYVFERGGDGMTQAERDDNDRPTRLAKEFYKFRKFGFEDIERKTKTSNALDLKKHLSRFADKNSRSNRVETTRTNADKKFSLGRLTDEF